MKFNTLLFNESAGVATITLNRPDKRNAISHELVDDLLLALDHAAQQESIHVVILTGAGKAFCSGMDLEDLKALATRSQAENVKDSETIARLCRSIYEFPKPTIAAVNGAAIAGGCGIATLCDFTLASHEARFGYTEVRIGFMPAIVSIFLIRQIGEKHARDLLLTGRILNADEAHRLGLVNDVVPPDQVMAFALQLARTLMENSPVSLRATKKLLSGYMHEELERQIHEAISHNAWIRTTEDFREGIAAFLEKRKPVWKGK
ncbi:MAG TPA: enoyl-CoA hydratase-related protein [Terriglobales bacterium]|jgi:methylglutaconyl-CoA hydratase|nr:enoyl-CoA hydratase-related protein [Terriglobales bacterium]